MDKPKRKRRTKIEMEAFRKECQNLSEKKDKASKLEQGALESKKVYETMPEPIKSSERASEREISGIVNVYKRGSKEYWMGSDIHKTLEEAKKVASKDCIGQIMVSFIDTGGN